MPMTIEGRAAFLAEEAAEHVGQLAALRLYHATPDIGRIEIETPDQLFALEATVSAHAEVARWNRDGQAGPLSHSAREVLRAIHEEETGFLAKERREAQPGNRLAEEDLAATARRLGIVTAALEKSGGIDG